jgi:hypothetical protein
MKRVDVNCVWGLNRFGSPPPHDFEYQVPGTSLFEELNASKSPNPHSGRVAAVHNTLGYFELVWARPVVGPAFQRPWGYLSSWSCTCGYLPSSIYTHCATFISIWKVKHDQKDVSGILSRGKLLYNAVSICRQSLDDKPP